MTQVSLICDETELCQRLSLDFAAGNRKPDVIARSLARITLYHQLNTIKINTNGKTVSEVVEELVHI